MISTKLLESRVGVASMHIEIEEKDNEQVPEEEPRVTPNEENFLKLTYKHESILSVTVIV